MVWAVFGEPVVAGEGDGFGGGVGTDVDLDLHLSTAKDDLVVGDFDVAAGHEALACGFLEDAEDPLFGVKDGVAGEEGSIDSDKGGGTKAAFDDAVLNGKIFAFIGGTGRAEEVESGGTADIDGALTSVVEMAFFYGDLAGATFELDGCAGGEASFADEVAASNERLVAANEVDPLPSPAGDGAVADGEFVEPAALDGVMIAFGADVADVELIKRDVFHRIRSLSAVVEVDAVGALATNFQMAEGESLAAGELERAVATFELRRLAGIERFESEVVDAGDVVSAGIVARGELQDGARLEIAECRFQCGGIADGDVSRMSAGEQGEAVGENTHDASMRGGCFHS